MYFPPEVLDEIFSHIHWDDKPSLRSFSLVSKSWLEPSRRLLFANVTITADTHPLWLKNVPRAGAGFPHHVRSLKCTLRRGRGCDIVALLGHLTEFSQLRSLSFSNMDIELAIPEDLEMFSAFKHTLSSLGFHQVSIEWSTFVALIGWFPNLKNLEIRMPWFRMEDRPVPRISHPLSGRLLVHPSPDRDMKPFADHFPGLKQEYEELAITGTYDHSLAVASRANLKSLEINKWKGMCPQCEWHRTQEPPYRTTFSSAGTKLDLSHFSKLHKLQITVSQQLDWEQILIPSITSTNLQKIAFKSPMGSGRGFRLQDPCWIPFDDVICELVDRLRESGYRNILEVEFQTEFEESGEGRKSFLPKFKEKGRVRVVSS